MLPKAVEPGEPGDWLRHAWSDLDLARVGQNSRILLEDLCFHAQQAAEKALKAVLVFRSVPFPKTHNIRTLMDLLPEDLNLREEAKGKRDEDVLKLFKKTLSVNGSLLCLTIERKMER